MSLKPRPLPPSPEAAGPGPSIAAMVPQKRKRVGIAVACNECRRRKARCDGERPACGPCRQRRVPCVFAEKPVDEAGEVIRALGAASESEALGLMRLLRRSPDLSSPARAGRALLGPRSSGPPPFPSLEYELMAKNPVSYPALHRLFALALGEDNLLRPVELGRPEDASPSGPAPSLEAAVLGPSPAAAIGPAADPDPLGVSEDPAANPFLARAGSAAAGSAGSADVCDARLRRVDFAFWTDVPVSNDVAAHAVSLYLKTDHPLLGIFDADLFVADLVARRGRYCSRLLANATLYWGSQMHSALDRDAPGRARLFGAEAEQLWHHKDRADSLANLASAVLLSLATLGRGQNHFFLSYLEAAVAMGERMSLLGVDGAVAAAAALDMTPDMRLAASYAAWGLFNSTVWASFFIRPAGFLCGPQRCPPALPVPPGPPSTPYMGQTFAAVCHFCCILHDLEQPRPAGEHLSLVTAEHKYRELLAWAEMLPAALVIDDESAHHVVVFHIWFHAAVLDIFRPFVWRPVPAQQQRLPTFSSAEGCAQAAFKASLEQLKRLIIIYRSCYRESLYSIHWHPGMLQVAKAVLEEPKEPTWRFYFLHCVYGYESLSLSYRVAESVGRALFAMALRRGDLSSDEVHALFCRLRGADLPREADEAHSALAADLSLALTDAEDSSVEKLARRFEEWVLFREFTRSEADEAGEGEEEEEEEEEDKAQS